MNSQEIKKLETKILLILKKHLRTGDTVVAGISGGPDSMFLLYLLEKLPIKIVVAHINHQLRKEASKDEEFVRQLCTHNGQKSATLTFTSLTVNIKSLSQKSNQGLEETGRKVRYEFFQKLAKKHRAKFIITAHHADDNLETIILNFARGASLQGLTGMQELETSAKNFSLLRPLLSISKKQILDFLRFHKLKFCVDKSNDSLVYKRNFIRHKIVPLLTKINPNITATLAKNTENIREINEFLKSEAENWLKKNSLDRTFKKFPAKNFRIQPKALQKIILFQIYKKHLGNTQNIQSINLDEVLTMISKNIGNKKKKFGLLTIALKNNTIIIKL